MRFPPAIIQLRRAQLILVLAVLVPTILLTAIGIVLLFFGEARSALAGVLVLTLCTTGITGYVLGSISSSGKGASLARVQNDFLSSVSHELRTPITSIRLLLESLADGRLEPGERTRVMQLLGQEAQRLESLAGRLIELSRMETGAHIFEQRPIDARELLRGGGGRVRRRHPERAHADRPRRSSPGCRSSGIARPWSAPWSTC